MTRQSNVQDSPGPQEDVELLKLILMDIINRLEDRKLSLDREIGSYPHSHSSMRRAVQLPLGPANEIF
jgi:hypothetical protein